ncbi:cytosolic sulfotransferase 5-like [Punica granatum]|uniref:Sulfotransferase n=2 Tax=Punica granatum TaxID=22663 RepID=A0A218VQF1_PUNGR|nr:cytosolic sulfotransferase 5-like [Punica granatum]OWM62725.1 hypothetical protein CDL15_Pgr020019 [Punica granatum]PKI55292.1 hypothetical protein CRG98_024308 [Punica granatum]
MATPLITATQCFVPKPKEEEKQVEETYKRYRQLIVPTLPRQKGWMSEHLYMHQDYWFETTIVEGVMYLQEHFKPRPADVLLATAPKCGTTWLKGLIFSIINRTCYNASAKDHPLLTAGVHECMPFLEVHLFTDLPIGDTEILSSPRLLSTHVPYAMLPESARGPNGCRIVHMWRNPRDAFVSFWHFVTGWRRKAQLSELSLCEAFDLFSQGVSPYGPFWDQILGYWKASQEYPDKVLFLKYEDMKRDPKHLVKKLAEFLGQPVTVEEEERGVVDEILALCSFESMSKAEVAEKGNFHGGRPSYKDFFRKGEVGDSKNLLTDDMIRRLEEITKVKFNGTGLEI